MSDALSQDKGEHRDHFPAPLAKRIIAYIMDAVLLFILIQLVSIMIPKLYDQKTVREFNELFHKASLLGSQERFNSSEMATLIERSELSEDTYNMIIFMAFIGFAMPVTYFFCGEYFFRGQTLGKATFGLRSVQIFNSDKILSRKVIIRAVLKGFATVTLITPFFLPGILNFSLCLFNSRKRCFHEILSGTITIQD